MTQHLHSKPQIDIYPTEKSIKVLSVDERMKIWGRHGDTMKVVSKKSLGSYHYNVWKWPKKVSFFAKRAKRVRHKFIDNSVAFTENQIWIFFLLNIWGLKWDKKDGLWPDKLTSPHHLCKFFFLVCAAVTMARRIIISCCKQSFALKFYEAYHAHFLRAIMCLNVWKNFAVVRGAQGWWAPQFTVVENHSKSLIFTKTQRSKRAAFNFEFSRENYPFRL